MFIDDALINNIDEGVASRVPAEDKTDLVMGQEVREIASGQTGTITSRVVYLNGCVHFGVTTKSTDNKNPDVFYVDHKRLELVGDGRCPNCGTDNRKLKRRTILTNQGHIIWDRSSS